MIDPTLCVGADVHLDQIALHVVDRADGHAVTELFRVTNNLPGAQAAATTLAQLARRLGYTRIEIGWEATGMLWIPFHRYLSHSAQLQPFDPQLVCFNSKLIKSFKDSLVLRNPKNDPRDAAAVAARLRFGELPLLLSSSLSVSLLHLAQILSSFVYTHFVFSGHGSLQ